MHCVDHLARSPGASLADFFSRTVCRAKDRVMSCPPDQPFILSVREFTGRRLRKAHERFRAHRRRFARSFSCESLEQRVVLSDWGGGNSLAAALAHVGVVTGPVEVGSPSAEARHDGSSGNSQLQTDLKALQTELQGLAAKSGLTVADLAALDADSQAIAQAGFRFDRTSLQKLVSELATAVAGNSSTTQAQNDFTALFSGSSVASTTITSAFNHLVKAIQDSGVTAADLTTVAADQAAVQTDLKSASGSGEDGFGGGWIGDVDAEGFGGSLAAALAHVGVVSSPSEFGGALEGPWNASAPQTSQLVLDTQPLQIEGPWSTGASQASPLGKDIQALQTELQSLAAKSGLTVADESRLASDSQAIAQAGFRINPQNLEKVTSELATAVAAGSSTSQAQTDFAALFSGSSVAQTTITTAFNDMVEAIHDSGVTSTDLTTVANDQAAIQNDLTSLCNGKPGTGGTSNSGGGSNSSGSGSTTGSGGTTGSGTTNPPLPTGSGNTASGSGSGGETTHSGATKNSKGASHHAAGHHKTVVHASVKAHAAKALDRPAHARG
jgi:hypothetical protein